MKDTRNKLLKVSACLFARKGFSGTSVRQIVSRAGVNICAVRYHFGDKYGLYLATVSYLMEKTNKQIFGAPHGIVLPDCLEKLDRKQALELLKRFLERFLELGFSRKNILLERIFTYAELERSDDLRRMLFVHGGKLQRVIAKLLRILTGAEENSAELLLLTHTIFGQINQSDFTRFVICRSLNLKKYTPEVCAQIKRVVWQNTYAILKTYEKGKSKK